MSEQNDTERNEPASPHKRDQARDKGNVALSRELPSVAVLAASLAVFSIGSGWCWGHLSDLFQMPLRLAGQMEVTTVTIWLITKELVWKMAVLFFPLLTAVVVAGVGSYLAQIGFLYAGEAMVPSFDRLNPINGVKNMFSIRSWVEALKCLIKIAIVSYVVWSVMKDEIATLAGLIHLPAWSVFTYMMTMMYRIMMNTLIVLVFLAILDYAYQRFDWEKKLRMSRDEIKEEHKHMEGDPKIKARIRTIQRETAMRRMMQAVPKADVVITNPTHLAVAVRYDPEKMYAPTVVAKGAGHVAEKIRQIAAAHGVPVVENKPVAQLLYKTVDVDRAIPEDLYRAVAEILAYVYGLKERAV